MATNRDIELVLEENRAGAQNLGTLWAPPRRQLPAQRGFGDHFVSHYAAFAPSCREAVEPGLAIVAIDEATHTVAGLLRLRARSGMAAAAVIGRHDGTDLYLDRTETLALRHLVVATEPQEVWPSPEIASYRVIDLRSGSARALAFRDEHGASFDSALAYGPSMVRATTYVFLFLPIGRPEHWPTRPHDAWQQLVERMMAPGGAREMILERRAVFGVAKDALRRPFVIPANGRPRHAYARVPRKFGNSSLLPIRGVLQWGVQPGGASLIRDDEAIAGTFLVKSPTADAILPVGGEALHGGVLFGRYERCNTSQLFQDNDISRVHLLAVELGGKLHAIDCGTVNGTLRNGETVERVALVHNGDRLELANKRHSVTWKETHQPPYSPEERVASIAPVGSGDEPEERDWSSERTAPRAIVNGS